MKREPKATPKKKAAELNIEKMDVAFLMDHKAEYNPRVISSEQRAGLSLSLEKFSYVQPIIYNRRTQRIVSGHQRLDLLHEKGYEVVDVNVVDLPENQEKELNLAMNSQTITGEFTEAVNVIVSEILDNDPEFYDMLNLGSIEVSFGDGGKGNGASGEKAGNETSEDLPEGMEVLPYEHYDCILVVFRNVNDFLLMSQKLGLDRKRVISAPMVKNKKIGKVRCVDANTLVKAFKAGDGEIDFALDDIEVPKI